MMLVVVASIVGMLLVVVAWLCADVRAEHWRRRYWTLYGSLPTCELCGQPAQGVSVEVDGDDLRYIWLCREHFLEDCDATLGGWGDGST